MPVRVTTIHPGVSGGQAAANYYSQYLSQAGEAPGEWVGVQAEKLGVSGRVETWQLAHLLAGLHPITGDGLGRPICDRTDENGKVRLGVSGFDVTFSAPKGASVLGLVFGSEAVLDAHRAAVLEVIGHVNQFGTTCRVGPAGGQVNVDTGGGVFAVFEQHTSRAGDPQLHTHVVLSNKVLRPDGKWGAIDGLYVKKQQQTLSGLYHRLFEAELVLRLPELAFAARANGVAELASPIVGREGEWDRLLEGFSKRTEQLDARFEEQMAEFRVREGRDPSRYERAAIERQAALDSRAFKEHAPASAPVLREAWQAEAATLGWTSGQLQPVLDEPVGLDVGRSRVAARERRVDDTLQHPTGPVELLQRIELEPSATSAGRPDGWVMGAGGFDRLEAALSQGSTWNRAHVLRALTEHVELPVGVDARRARVLLDAAADRFLAERCVCLDPPVPDGTPRRLSDGRALAISPTASQYTTDRILIQEETITSRFLDATLTPSAPAGGTGWEERVAVNGLDRSQSAAAAMVAGTAPLGLVVGPAGTGKTTTMRTAADHLEAEHRQVFGVAPTARAAAELAEATGMVTDSVAKLLYEHTPGLHHPGRVDHRPGSAWDLGAGATVIVDESSMVTTNDLHRLLELAALKQWRVMLVGDPSQLAAVGRGGMFNELCTTMPTFELTEVRRFVADWEKTASLDLRAGRSDVHDTYLANERVHAGLLEEHLDTVTDRWLQASQAGETIAITVSTNDEVATVNTAIQKARVARGELIWAYGVDAAGGDRVMPGDVVQTRRNDRELRTSKGLPVLNRQTWEIQATNTEAGHVIVYSPEIGTVELNADYVRNHVRLAYAATAHGTQGLTVDHGILLAGATTDHPTLYEGLTRGRYSNHVYVITPSSGLLVDDAREEAVGLLDDALHRHRADVPAVSVRRELAAAFGTTPIPPAVLKMASAVGAEPAPERTVAAVTPVLAAEPLVGSQVVRELFEEHVRLVEQLEQAGRRVGYERGAHRDAATVLRDHDRATGLLRNRLHADQQALDAHTGSGALHRARHRSEIISLETRVSTMLRELHQADAQRPELVRDRDSAAQALTRTLDTTQRVTAQVAAIEADLAIDGARRLTAGVAPSVIDRVDDLLGRRSAAVLRDRAAVWDLTAGLLVERHAAYCSFEPTQLPEHAQERLSAAQITLGWDPRQAWTPSAPDDPRTARIAHVRAAALGSLPTISDLHADAVTELTDRRHAVTVVQQAYGEVLGAHRQRMVLVGHVEALRNEPESWPTNPVAATDDRVLAAARAVTRSREDQISAQLDLNATRGFGRTRAERRLDETNRAVLDANHHLAAVLQAVTPELTADIDQRIEQLTIACDRLAHLTGLQLQLLPEAGTRDLIDEHIVASIDELALLIDQGHGNEYSTAVVRAHTSLIDAILEQYPERALQTRPMADFLAGELERREELETDILDIEVEIDLKAQEIEHGLVPPIDRDLDRGVGMHM